jgi:hypothetical protein
VNIAENRVLVTLMNFANQRYDAICHKPHFLFWIISSNFSSFPYLFKKSGFILAFNLYQEIAVCAAKSIFYNMLILFWDY